MRQMLTDTQRFSLENSMKMIMENFSIDFVLRNVSFIISLYGNAHAHAHAHANRYYLNHACCQKYVTYTCCRFRSYRSKLSWGSNNSFSQRQQTIFHPSTHIHARIAQLIIYPFLLHYNFRCSVASTENVISFFVVLSFWERRRTRTFYMATHFHKGEKNEGARKQKCKNHTLYAKSIYEVFSQKYERRVCVCARVWFVTSCRSNYIIDSLENGGWETAEWAQRRNWESRCFSTLAKCALEKLMNFITLVNESMLMNTGKKWEICIQMHASFYFSFTLHLFLLCVCVCGTRCMHACVMLVCSMNCLMNKAKEWNEERLSYLCCV